MAKTMPLILTEAHAKEIDAKLRKLAEFPRAADLVEKCGVDCTEYRELANSLREAFQLVKKTFFPRRM